MPGGSLPVLLTPPPGLTHLPLSRHVTVSLTSPVTNDLGDLAGDPRGSVKATGQLGSHPRLLHCLGLRHEKAADRAAQGRTRSSFV